MSAPVQVPLRRKYTVRKVVKQVTAKGGGNTASLTRRRNAYLPPVKNTSTGARTPPVMVLDAGTGKHRWTRG